MTRTLTLAIALAAPGFVWAALAPIYQNPKDLAVLVAFVRTHPVVMAGLRAIDFENKIVRFGENCEARFGRVAAPSIPGPAPALEFRSSNCPIGAEQGAGSK